MRKLIWAINVTIDGYSNHTAMIADDELHYFFADLLKDIHTVIFGRKTYELLESFWPTAASDPGSTKSMIEFANTINPLPKIVVSKTLEKVNWNTKLLKTGLVEEVLKMKEQSGKPLVISGISIASALIKMNLIDEYWFAVHPIILGNGKQLFENIKEKKNLKFIDMIRFKSGVVVLHYERLMED